MKAVQNNTASPSVATICCAFLWSDDSRDTFCLMHLLPFVTCDRKWTADPLSAVTSEWQVTRLVLFSPSEVTWWMSDVCATDEFRTADETAVSNQRRWC